MSSSDEEDYDYNSLQTITLFDYEPTADGAKLKFEFGGTDFHYDENSEAQPDEIVDEDIGDGALSLKCDITKVVNGLLSDDGPPATLIVFQFAFIPHGNNHRFKKVEIAITFSSGKVHSISPNNEWTTLPSEIVQERTHTVSPSIEAAVGPAKAATSYTWQRKETQTIRGYAKVTGEIKSLGQSHGMWRKRRNAVMWGLYEDAQAPTGLPSLLESAVLLEREATDKKPFGERFSATIRIHGNVDRAARVKDKLEQVEKWMSGGTRKGKDIWFHPHPRTNKGTAVHSNSLEDEDLDAYRHLIAIRAWGATPTEKAGKGAVADQAQDPPASLTQTKEAGLTAPPDVGGQSSSSGLYSTPMPADPRASSPSPSASATLSPTSPAPTQTQKESTKSPAQSKVPITPGNSSGANDPIPKISNPATNTSTLRLANFPEERDLPLLEKGRRAKTKKTALPRDLADSEDDEWYKDKETEDNKDEDEDDQDEDRDGELPNLHEHLRLVRAEAKWTVRVIRLLAEERRLLRRIAGAGGGRSG